MTIRRSTLHENELINAIEFQLPGKFDHFNFEKVSKRHYLDIASVNTAIKLTIENNEIRHAHLSAGGIARCRFIWKKLHVFWKGKISMLIL